MYSYRVLNKSRMDHFPHSKREQVSFQYYPYHISDCNIYHWLSLIWNNSRSSSRNYDIRGTTSFLDKSPQIKYLCLPFMKIIYCNLQECILPHIRFNRNIPQPLMLMSIDQYNFVLVKLISQAFYQQVSRIILHVAYLYRSYTSSKRMIQG